jgi:hypothetical protein
MLLAAHDDFVGVMRHCVECFSKYFHFFKSINLCKRRRRLRVSLEGKINTIAHVLVFDSKEDSMWALSDEVLLECSVALDRLISVGVGTATQPSRGRVKNRKASLEFILRYCPRLRIQNRI